MKLIPLGQSGFFAKVDDADFKWLSMWKWRLHKSGRGQVSAGRGSSVSGKYRIILMHRVILDIVDSKVQVDHINGDTLDNQKSNLRRCNNQQNSWNRGLRSDNQSHLTGVYKNKRSGRFYSQITLDGRTKHLGCFRTIEEASAARNQAVLEMYGEFGRLHAINN